MTNEDYALLLDPERRMPGWWRQQQKRVCRKCGSDTKIVGLARICASMACLSDSLKLVPHGTPSFTGPDWHADDLACFRDWRPVLLAAGCVIGDSPAIGTAVWLSDTGPEITESDAMYTYRAATLAAIEELHTTKPELLREVIARVEGGANG